MISSEKTFQGAWRFSTIIKGHLFSMQYMGYTKREALRLFKQDMRNHAYLN